MKNLIHELTKLVEEFIKLERYVSNKMNNDYDLCYALYSRDLKKILEAKYSMFEKRYNEAQYIDSNMPIEEYLGTLSGFYAIRSFTSLAYGGSDEVEFDLVKESDNNLFSILIRALRSMPNYFVAKQVIKTKHAETTLLHEFLNYLSPEYFELLLSKSQGKARIGLQAN